MPGVPVPRVFLPSAVHHIGTAPVGQSGARGRLLVAADSDEFRKEICADEVGLWVWQRRCLSVPARTGQAKERELEIRRAGSRLIALAASCRRTRGEAECGANDR
jgi:hypothetical protein